MIKPIPKTLHVIQSICMIFILQHMTFSMLRLAEYAVGGSPPSFMGTATPCGMGFDTFHSSSCTLGSIRGERTLCNRVKLTMRFFSFLNYSVIFVLDKEGQL